MSDKNVGIPRPSKDKSKGKPGSMKDMNILDNLLLQNVWYMELAKSAKLYLAQNKRLTQGIAFRLDVEIHFIVNQLKNWAGVSPSWVNNTAQEIRKDEEMWFKEVKKFADLLVPEKSLIVTDNLEKEMMNIKGRNALLGEQPPGKGKIII